jgi:mannose-6-phosphate isomerase-like protein (cupin superfamily)
MKETNTGAFTQRMQLNLAKLAKLTDYHTVLYTGKCQITHRHLMPDEYIPEEVHEVDQIFQILDGRAIIVVNGKVQSYDVTEECIVSAGQSHMVRPFPNSHVSLISFYSSPLHPAGEVEKRGPKFPESAHR